MSYIKINGLTQKPSLAQIITYLTTIAQILSFYIIIQNRLE